MKVMLLLKLLLEIKSIFAEPWVPNFCGFGVLEVLKIKCSNNVPYTEREENCHFLMCPIKYSLLSSFIIKCCLKSGLWLFVFTGSSQDF